MLAGCGSMSNFDPTDMLDFLDTKKKLPGERKPVFPEGVPGLEQGVPKDLYKGSAQEQPDQQNAAGGAPPPPPPAEEPKAKQPGKKTRPTSRPLGRRRSSRSGRRSQCAAAAPGSRALPPPAPPPPKPKKIVRRRTTAPPPDQQTANRPRSRPQPATTIRRAIPGAVAEQHFPALIRLRRPRQFAPRSTADRPQSHRRELDRGLKPQHIFTP